MISVVIPVYKVEKYIENCIQSIIKQKSRNFEVIIVDDGTPDKSAEIAEKLLLRETNIPYSVIHTVNRGVSAARNIGIINAHGEYIIMVDADDILSPLFLTEYNKMIENHGESDIYSSGFSVVKEGNNIQFLLNHDEEQISLTSSDAQVKFINRQIKFLLPTFLIRKKFLDKYQIKFDENVSYSEDVQFIWRCLAYNSKPIIHSAIKNYNYIFHANSTMTSSDLKKINTGFMGALKVEKEVKELLTEKVKRCFVPASFFSLLHGASKIISYSDFKKLCEKNSMSYYLMNLIKTGNIKTKIISLSFLISTYLCYKIMRKY